MDVFSPIAAWLPWIEDRYGTPVATAVAIVVTITFIAGTGIALALIWG